MRYLFDVGHCFGPHVHVSQVFPVPPSSLAIRVQMSLLSSKVQKKHPLVFSQSLLQSHTEFWKSTATTSPKTVPGVRQSPHPEIGR